jgi:hypothetical protein
VAVAASWFTSVASRSIDDSTSVHRVDDMVAGVPIASFAATRSCNANPWELTARARERQARASRRREAIRATISATTIAAIATSTQIHGEVVDSSALADPPASSVGSSVGSCVDSSVGSSLGSSVGSSVGSSDGSGSVETEGSEGGETEAEEIASETLDRMSSRLSS